MKRLVYSPKAYVYIQTDERSEKVPDGIYNISDLVVSGSITRKVNQISTANVTFQNPGFQFTKPGAPTFHPMDKITIFLQRLPHFPVQSFTGYLDETPYYQMYPGTVSLRASCTLKRLQHTYFDPGLPFMLAFMARYGWFIDPAGGGASNTPTKSEGAETADSVQSASLTDLMYACLKHIGGLPKEQILIEDLPPDLTKRLAPLYFILSERAKEATKHFNEWLNDFIGGEKGSGGTSNSASGDGEGDPGNHGQYSKKYPMHYIEDSEGHKRFTPMEIRTCAELAGFKPGVALQMAQIAHGESNYYPGMQQHDPGNGLVGYGLLQMTPHAWGSAGVAKMNKLGGKDAMFIPIQNLRMAKYLYDQGGLSQWYGTSYLDRNLDVSGVTSVLTDSDTGSKDDSDGQAADSEKYHGGPEGTGQTTENTSGSGKIYAPIAGDVVYGRGWQESSKGVHGTTTTSGSTHWHSGIDAAVPGGTPCIAPCDGEISMAQANWSDGGMVHFKFTKAQGQIKAGTIIGWGHVVKIRVKVGDKVRGGDQVADSGVPAGGAHVHFVQCNNGDGGGDGDTDPVPLLRALQKGETVPTDATGDPSADANSGSGYADALAAARAGSVFTTVNFPQAVDAAESIMLTGDMALMNDQPLLPFIEQLANGSLRNFMSLPNGDFYCFHPDYFGSMGTSPYWDIDDLEVLDGGIQLTDDALATHVYVVGGTLPDFGNFDIAVKLQTHGVVNILNAGTADFLNVEPEKAKSDNKPAKEGDKKPEEDLHPFLGDAATVMQFLQRYGARPHYETAPFVRSHIFETFYAYQKFMLLWARQFQTTFTFTFMPEIYPGGLVRFTGHGIQMYVDEVNHSWDYESGFTTQASLTAPSADPNSNKKSISRGMVRTVLGRPVGSV